MLRLFICIMMIIPAWLFGQIDPTFPPICGPNGMMESFCADACIICDIDGFTGRNDQTINGQKPPGFCTTIAHRMQWLGFIAGTTDITLKFDVFNCDNGEGLEVGIYRSLDCTTFQLVSECDGDIFEGTSRLFTNTVPLEIGQYYYFVMDGNSDDECSYKISVVNGSTKVLPLDVAPEINFPKEICENEIFNLTTPGLLGATIYRWTLDGQTLSYNKNHQTSLPNAGTYNICLEASNVCDEAPPICKTITVRPIKSTNVTETICYNDCLILNGKTYCTTGNFTDTLTANTGCDSILYINLTIKPQQTEKVEANFCSDQTFVYNGITYTQAGEYQTQILGDDGCDIYVTLQLSTIECNIQSTSLAFDAKCFGDANGVFTYAVVSGTPPFTYSWFKLNEPSFSGTGSINALNQIATVNGLKAGSYQFTLLDNFGNGDIISFDIKQPPALVVEQSVVDYNGYNVPCFNDAKGEVTLSAMGGNPGYSIKWWDGLLAKSRFDLKAGTYTATITDTKGCTTTEEVTITQPDSLAFVVDFLPLSCAGGDHSGSILSKVLTGGVPGYSLSLNNVLIDSLPVLGLAAGSYLVKLWDKNGCTTTASGTLDSLYFPRPNYVTAYEISLGDSVKVQGEIGLEEYTAQWLEDSQLSCTDCAFPYIKGINDGQFQVKITSISNCDTTILIRVKVNKDRTFMVNNVISTNDNANNHLVYNANNGVLEVSNVAIYDRWGSKVFEGGHYPNGIYEIPTDVLFNGQSLITGVYAMIIKVKYLDGVEEIYKGDLTILH